MLLRFDIILDVVFGRPGEPASSALIASCRSQTQAWVSQHSVATRPYLIEQECNPAVVREVAMGYQSGPGRDFVKPRLPTFSPEEFLARHRLK